jgi:hypothetical protein
MEHLIRILILMLKNKVFSLVYRSRAKYYDFEGCFNKNAERWALGDFECDLVL